MGGNAPGRSVRAKQIMPGGGGGEGSPEGGVEVAPDAAKTLPFADRYPHPLNRTDEI